MTKYDLEAMNFAVKSARAGDLIAAFHWSATPEGGEFWVKVWFGEIPEAEWRPKVNAMIDQWEAENN